MSKTVIEMAKEAGFPFNKFGLLQGDDNGEIDVDQMLEVFAELVRADAITSEREACAKVCSEAAERALALQSGGDDLSCVIVRHHAVAHLADAAAIRSRENT